LWQWNSLRAHQLFEFDSCKRFLERTSVFQAFTELHEKFNIITVVLEPSVGAILSRIVLSPLCFLSLLSSLKQPSHRWSSHFIELVVSACIPAFVGRRDDVFADFLLFFTNELLHNV